MKSLFFFCFCFGTKECESVNVTHNEDDLMSLLVVLILVYILSYEIYLNCKVV